MRDVIRELRLGNGDFRACRCVDGVFGVDEKVICLAKQTQITWIRPPASIPGTCVLQEEDKLACWR